MKTSTVPCVMTGLVSIMWPESFVVFLVRKLPIHDHFLYSSDQAVDISSITCLCIYKVILNEHADNLYETY